MSTLRRLHSRIIGLGSVCGLPPSPPAELFLKSLPPPSEVDPVKYHRFQEEERGRQAPRHLRQAGDGTHRSPEPFYEVVAGASGHKHLALLTRENSLITFGENRYGQTAAPKKDEEAAGEREDHVRRHRDVGAAESARGTRAPHSARTPPSLSAVPSKQTHNDNPDWAPLFIDLGDTFASNSGQPTAPARVACGSNFTIVYQPGGRRAIAFGNNHVGQLGVGHKNHIDSVRGFEEWNPLALWWPARRDSVIAGIVSGYNHSIVQLSCGSLFSFGSNTWGELSVGTTVSPMQPERITFFDEKEKQVKKVAAGNSFTLFLTTDGRVYGCGATNFGQLPSNSFDPVPVPLVRSYVEGATAAARAPGPSSSSNKLIRIKNVACVGSLAVYVSVGNEILVQGSLPAYGVATHAPRISLVSQDAAIGTLKQRMSELGWRMEEVDAPDGFTIRDLVAGPSTLLVRYQNGCVGALGANSEGQLHNVTKNINGRAVNLAPSFSSVSLFPVFAPSAALRGESFESLSERVTFLCGSGFTLLIDNDEVYPVKEYVKPIELPPGRAAERGKLVAASGAPPGGAGKTRRERLRSSLK